jgi:type IV secretory pathway component VirB8
VKIEPFTKGTNGFEIMTEMLVRDYVLARHEVVLDEGELRRRWGGQGMIAHRSDAEEYRRFVAETAPKFDEIRQRRLVRSVLIHRVSKIADGFWQVEFSTVDTQNGNQVAENAWVASLTVHYVPTQVVWEDRYMNPLGFVVTGYSVTARQ